MTAPLYNLGHFCVRHKFIVIAVWLVAFIALAAVSVTLGQNTSDNLTLPGTDSQKATDLLDKKFPEQANGTVPVVFVAPHGHKLDESTYEDAIKQVNDDYKNDKHAVDGAVSPFDSDGAAQLSKDKTVGYISLTLKQSPSEMDEKAAQDILDVANPGKTHGMQVSVGAYVGQKLSKSSTHLSEVVGLAAAVIILLFTFGTFVAMGMPILTAIIALVSGLSVIGILGQVVQVPTTAPALATMIGLGVGIDYGLFIVTRHRYQLQHDKMEIGESIARANATSGGAVVFAGGTVIIALVSLLVAGIPLVTTLGYTAGIVVLIAVLAATTLLPAVLALLGPRINALKIPGLKHEHDAKPHGWRRWAMFVARHPWPSMGVALVILIVLALPVRNLHLGQTDNGALPKDTQTRMSYDAICRGFGCGQNGPMLVAVSPEQAGPERPEAARRRRAATEGRAEEAAGPGPEGHPERDPAARGPGRAPAAGPAAGHRRRQQAAEAGEREEPEPDGPDQAAGGLPQDDGFRPAPPGHAHRHAEDVRRQVGHAAAGQRQRRRRRLHGHLGLRALVDQDRGRRQRPARQHDPQGHQGPGHDRRRGRPDGRLHRSREADQQQAPADHRRGAGAVVPAPAPGLPVGARAAEGRDHEPALDRGRVRRRDLRVRPSLVGHGGRAGDDRADRLASCR